MKLTAKRRTLTTKKIVVLCLVAFVAACATVKAVPSGTYRVGSAYEIELGQTWSQFSSTAMRGVHSTVLTIDGPALNQLHLFSDIEPGDSLLKEATEENPVPKFKKTNDELEIAQFIADSLAVGGFERIETQSLRPAAFGSQAGVRFELTGATDDGLNIAGTALFTDVAGKLQVILFIAPALHYYDLRAEEIERIMQSAVVI